MHTSTVLRPLSILAASIVPAAFALAAPPDHIIVASGTTLRALTLPEQLEIWSATLPFTPTGIFVLPDGDASIILAGGDSQVSAIDGYDGSHLWTQDGDLSHMAHDLHGQLFQNALQFPYGAPNFGGTPSADLLMLSVEAHPRTTRLIDARTGETLWTRTEESDTRGFQYLATPQGSYDIIFATEDADMLRVRGSDGQQVVWSRTLRRRWGIPIPDVNGDGQYDFLGAPVYFNPPDDTPLRRDAGGRKSAG